VLDLWYGSFLFRRPELELTKRDVFKIEARGVTVVRTGVAVRARRSMLCREAMTRRKARTIIVQQEIRQGEEDKTL
jgi:hypothetical protein